MVAKRCSVRITANFEANLADIERFLAEADAGASYNALLDDLLEHVIPTLEHHPEIGRSIFAREAQSVETRLKAKKIADHIGSMSLREYIAGDFLMLYAVRVESVYLLSIKHHRQLSFDFPAHWD